VDIKAYIESGVIESYVLGMADDQEAAELVQLSRQYSEIREAIDAFELALEKQAIANAIPPSADVKKHLIFLQKKRQKLFLSVRSAMWQPHPLSCSQPVPH
jgi:hypothetical protein